MKYVKMLGLLAVAAAALMAFAGSASATTLTSPAGTIYSGKIHATAGTGELHGEAFGVHCEGSTVTAEIKTQGSATTAHGPVTTLDFFECDRTVTVLTGGELIVHGTSKTGNGTLTSSGARITIHGPFGINCLFETDETHIGTVTGSDTAHATLDIESAAIPRVEHSAFCGASGEWTGDYTVTTPKTLSIH